MGLYDVFEIVGSPGYGFCPGMASVRRSGDAQNIHVCCMWIVHVGPAHRVSLMAISPSVSFRPPMICFLLNRYVFMISTLLTELRIPNFNIPEIVRPFEYLLLLKSFEMT
jgi:hypothetical protein